MIHLPLILAQLLLVVLERMILRIQDDRMVIQDECWREELHLHGNGTRLTYAEQCSKMMMSVMLGLELVVEISLKACVASFFTFLQFYSFLIIFTRLHYEH